MEDRYVLVEPMTTEQCVEYTTNLINKLTEFIAYGGLYNANDVIRIKEEIDKTKRLLAEVINIDKK
jgi:hypothetical protein